MAEKKTGNRRYGVWAGNPNGRPENLALCVEGVTSNDRAAIHSQCSRKRGYGPDGLYCKPHSEKYLTDPIATWYYTRSTGFSVTPEPVFKITEKTITIRQGSGLHATNKRGYFDYWPTREAALAHLQKRLDAMRRNLQQAEKEYAEVLEDAE